jgi:hypothetical protein
MRHASTGLDQSLLPFRPVAGIRGAVRIPEAAGAYQGIRANMEQTSARVGLDQYGRGRLRPGKEGPWPSSAKVQVPGMTQYARYRRSPAKAVATVRDLCWQRRNLTRDHSLGIVPDVRSRRYSRPRHRVPRSCPHRGWVP